MLHQVLPGGQDSETRQLWGGTAAQVPQNTRAALRARTRCTQNLLHVVAIAVSSQPDVTLPRLLEKRQAIAFGLEVLASVDVGGPRRAHAQRLAHPLAGLPNVIPHAPKREPRAHGSARSCRRQGRRRAFVGRQERRSADERRALLRAATQPVLPHAAPGQGAIEIVEEGWEKDREGREEREERE